MAARAKSLAIISMSKGDMRVVDHVLETYQQVVREAFRDLRSSVYLECESLIAQVGHDPSEDRIFALDLTGSLVAMDDRRYVVLPYPNLEDQETEWTIAVSPHTTMAQALKLFKDELTQRHTDTRRGPMMLEVAILSRTGVQEKLYESVYHKCTPLEVEHMLQG